MMWNQIHRLFIEDREFCMKKKKRKKKGKKEKFETIWIRKFGFVKMRMVTWCLIPFFIETIVATSWMDI